jgi:hypothetical protein
MCRPAAGSFEAEHHLSASRYDEASVQRNRPGRLRGSSSVFTGRPFREFVATPWPSGRPTNLSHAGSSAALGPESGSRPRPESQAGAGWLAIHARRFSRCARGSSPCGHAIGSSHVGLPSIVK